MTIIDTDEYMWRQVLSHMDHVGDESYYSGLKKPTSVIDKLLNIILGRYRSCDVLRLPLMVRIQSQYPICALCKCCCYSVIRCLCAMSFTNVLRDSILKWRGRALSIIPTYPDLVLFFSAISISNARTLERIYLPSHNSHDGRRKQAFI